jgi:hypothetical protein
MIWRLRADMVYSTTGYCHCGYEVWIEFLWDGQKWIHRFSDEHLNEIARCPGCQRKLIEDELEIR